MKSHLEELVDAHKISQVDPCDNYSVTFLVPKKSTPFYRMVIDYCPVNLFIDVPVSEFIPQQQLLAGFLVYLVDIMS